MRHIPPPLLIHVPVLPAGKGHDSLEDAVAALDLLKEKVKELHREEERRLHQERHKRGSQQLPPST